MGLIVTKEVLETTATPTVGGPELSSREVWPFTLLENLSSAVQGCVCHPISGLSSSFNLKYCLVYIEDSSSVISFSAVVFQSPAGVSQQSSAACTGVAPFATMESLALNK